MVAFVRLRSDALAARDEVADAPSGFEVLCVNRRVCVGDPWCLNLPPHARAKGRVSAPQILVAPSAHRSLTFHLYGKLQKPRGA
jgi:hypothetical protein